MTPEEIDAYVQELRKNFAAGIIDDSLGLEGAHLTDVERERIRREIEQARAKAAKRHRAV